MQKLDHQRGSQKQLCESRSGHSVVSPLHHHSLAALARVVPLPRNVSRACPTYALRVPISGKPEIGCFALRRGGQARLLDS